MDGSDGSEPVGTLFPPDVVALIDDHNLLHFTYRRRLIKYHRLARRRFNGSRRWCFIWCDSTRRQRDRESTESDKSLHGKGGKGMEVLYPYSLRTSSEKYKGQEDC